MKNNVHLDPYHDKDRVKKHMKDGGGGQRGGLSNPSACNGIVQPINATILMTYDPLHSGPALGAFILTRQAILCGFAQNDPGSAF